jgi:hypothetical protein
VILDTIGSLIVGAVGAGIGWALMEFLARPIRRFYDLRGETIRKVSSYSNLPARYDERHLADGSVVRSEDVTLSQADLAKLDDARSDLRDLAAQMRGFAFNETMAKQALVMLGYDPQRASEGLFGIANTVDTTGDTRISNKKIVTETLRLPEHIL